MKKLWIAVAAVVFCFTGVSGSSASQNKKIEVDVASEVTVSLPKKQKCLNIEESNANVVAMPSKNKKKLVIQGISAGKSKIKVETNKGKKVTYTVTIKDNSEQGSCKKHDWKTVKMNIDYPEAKIKREPEYKYSMKGWYICKTCGKEYDYNNIGERCPCFAITGNGRRAVVIKTLIRGDEMDILRLYIPDEYVDYNLAPGSYTYANDTEINVHETKAHTEVFESKFCKKCGVTTTPVRKK